MSIKILLAGPGTGKTTKIKEIIQNHGNPTKFLVISFTNATVNDLQKNLLGIGVPEKNCMTLHSFAVKYNIDKSRHLLLSPEESTLKKIEKGAKISFEKLCDFLSATTFDQMIYRFVEYAKNNPLYLENELEDFDSIIIDEYQDFNHNEQNLIDILINKINTSYILGDDDQCIYDFKDASSDKIISIHKSQNNEVISHEHICYRCPDKIVEHGTHLIKNNSKRVEKEWSKSGRVGTLEHFQLNNSEEVAEHIYQKLVELKFENSLILTPVAFAVEPVIKKLQENNIKFSNFFIDKIPAELIEKSWEIKSIFGNFNYLNLTLLGYKKLSNRKKFYECLKNQFDKGQDCSNLIQVLNAKIPDNLKDNQKSIEDFLSDDYYSDILELYKKAKGESLNEKLENIFREIEQEKEESIRIMSIHKSKGLGESNVFIVGLNEGVLPRDREKNDNIEAQRRLFFVGITRAKNSLFLYSNLEIEGKYANKVNKSSFKWNIRKKSLYGKTSTFVNELKLNE